MSPLPVAHAARRPGIHHPDRGRAYNPSPVETGDSARAAANAASGERALTVMACGICEVTWRGRLGDSCWACGHSAHTVIAPPLQVKIPAPA